MGTLELVSFFIFFLSGIGIALILLPKLSQLKALPSDGRGFEVKERALKVVRRLGQSERVKSLAPEKLAHRALSKTRVLALRTESKAGKWLEDMRQRAQEKKEKFSSDDNYWKELRKRR
ncbi:MAG: hypothetical protein Q8Q38_00245 [bacterium]|nr:hypothetical protein [bacterium]